MRLHDFGALGVAVFAIHKLSGFPKTLLASPPRLTHPVRLRVETTDIAVFDDVIIKQDYSFGLPSTATVIVDAGANIGLTSIFYSTRFPHARILAIEPEQSNFEMLQSNVRPYPNITPIHAALWHSEGYISIGHPQNEPFGHWGFAVSGDPGNVRAVTLASLMRDFGLNYIDILKVNIEAAEKEVFEACDWESKVESVVIELHDHIKPGCSEAVNQALKCFSRTSSGYLTCYKRQRIADNAPSDGKQPFSEPS
jgi:FkbM family methyltransferase